MITVYLSVCLSCFITLCLGQFRYLELELSQVSELELYSLFLVWNDIPVSHRLYVLCLIHSKRLSRFLNLVLCCGPFEHALKYGPRAACCPQSQLVLECGSCSRISSSLITAAASFMVSWLIRSRFLSFNQPTPWNSPWEAKSYSASQEIPHLSWIPKFHYRFRKSPPLVPTLGRLNSIHIVTPHSFEIHFNVSFHPSTSRSIKRSLSLKFWYHTSSLVCILYVQPISSSLMTN